MTAPNELHVQIDLRPGRSAPPSGRVRAEDGDREFVGWVGLLLVLAEIVERSAVAPDDLGGERDP